MEKYNKILDYEVLAYVIMNNHYHLLLKTNKSPINQVMFYLNNLLGKYIKSSLDRTGHAFEGRYKCKLIDSDAYLIWLLRYIHRNPIKANICGDLGDYPWSSHYLYKNNISNNGTNIKAPIKFSRQTLDEIILNISVNNGTLIDIRNGSRKQILTPIKIGIIKSALEECYSLREIADFLNAAPSTISKLISRGKII